MTHRFHPHDEPDPQSLLDFGDALADGTAGDPANELEATMLRVQRGLGATSLDTTTMPDDVRTRIREELMHAAAPPADIAGPHPSAPRPRARRRQPSAPAPRHPMPRMAWSGAANIALAVMLLIAAFGAWRLWDDSFNSGGRTPGEGHYAYAPVVATPAASEESAIAPSPEAHADSDLSCDISDDIPIFSNVSGSPVDGTSLYFQNQTLWLHCSGEAEDMELAQGVVNISAGPFPGTVAMSVLPEGATGLMDQNPGYLNLASGKAIEFTTPDESMQFSLATGLGSPWVIGSSATASSGMQVVDLRTMEVTDLSVLAGGTAIVPNQVIANGASESGTLAVSFKGADLVEVDQATGAGTVTPGETAREAGLPGDILIINDTIDSAHWINLPDDLQNLRDMWLSPDGSALAIASFESGADPYNSPYTYAILNTTDGSELGRTQPIEFRDNPFVLWLDDGTSIAYTSLNTVQTLAAEPGAQPETILEGDQQFFSVRTTTDPDVIVATTRADHGSDADPDSTDGDKVYSVNLATGDTHEFGGMDLGNMIGWNTSANALLIYDYIGMSEGEVTIRVFDPVSGQLLDTIDNVPNPNNTGRMLVGKNSITTSDDGSTSAYTIGSQDIFVVKATEEGLSFRKLDPPSSLNGTATIVLSPDGNMLSMINNNDESGTRWMLELADPDAKWLEVHSEGAGVGSGYIGFIKGTGD